MDSVRRAEFFEVLRDALRTGVEVSDDVFDRVYPDAVSYLSSTHFTPVAVARRAAEWLVPRHHPAPTVLDVGAGAGKACLIGSLVTGAEFVGVEQRRWLAAAAEQAASLLRADTCRFLAADALAMDWSLFEGIYMFNPFYENTDPKTWIDRELPLGPALHARSIAATRARLASTRRGTRVVTYHGFGAERPEGFRATHRETIAGGALELWVRE